MFIHVKARDLSMAAETSVPRLQVVGSAPPSRTEAASQFVISILTARTQRGCVRSVAVVNLNIAPGRRNTWWLRRLKLLFGQIDATRPKSFSYAERSLGSEARLASFR